MFSRTASYIPHIKLIIAATVCTLLIGCSGGSDTTSSFATIQGNAVKGVIENGLVRAYLVENQAGVMKIAAQPTGELVRSNALGAYELTLSGQLENQTVVIEMTADSLTRMTCDVTDGCGLDNNNIQINYGDKFALSSEFSLKGALVGVGSGEIFTTHLSPLSHMAVAYAESGIGGLTPASVVGAYSHIETMMDLDAGALTLAPADITTLNSTTSLSKSEIEMGVISAAFLSLVNTADWDSIEEVLAHLETQMQNTGQLTAVNLGALRDVALDELFSNAVDIVDGIVQAEPNSPYSTILTIVSTETAQSYQDASDEGQNTAPVQFTTHPQSDTVDEGEQVQFSVGVTGGGTLSFQWRKDGVNITGATGSTLVVSIAELSDAGTYDVIVSNAVGSLTSLSALLAVNDNGGSNGTMLASVELNWDIPLQREDGTDLELYEINGYVISYGISSGSLSTSITVLGAAETSTLIDQLSANTYYFAIATIDSDGQQGSYSTEISQVVL